MNPADPIDHNHSLALSSFITTILSLIASLLVIIIHLSVREIRSHFFFRIAFHISFSDLLFSLSSLYIHSPLNLSLCTALGVTREFTWLASMAWTTILPYTIYKSLQESLTDEELDQNKPRYIMFGYVVPLIFSIIPALTLKNIYGHSDMYCWISSDSKSEFLTKSLLLYLPLAISAIFTTIWCFRMRRWVKFLLKRSASQNFIKLLYYPLIMLLCNIGAVGHGFQKVFGDNRGFLWLTSVFIIGRQAQGLLNGLVYVLNDQVRKAVKRKFVRRINRKRSNSDGQYEVPFIYNISGTSFEDQVVVNTEECYKYFNTKKTMVE